MKAVVIVLLSITFLFLMALLPVPLPPYLDFQVIYHADLGLLRGIPLYDHAGQVNMISELAGVPADQVYVLPFPYPPWYALATLWLAWLPIDMAVRVWFGLNLLMLLGSIGLMTGGWITSKRLLSLLPSFLFLPVLGALFVGQYVFPVLLSAALLVYTLENEKPLWIVPAAALLTFKPHVGGLILLAGLVYLVIRKDSFGYRSLIYTIITGVILTALGFLADPAWPLNYFHSLQAFGQVPGVSICTLCTSLPVVIARVVNGQTGFTPAPLFGLVVLIILAILWGSTRRSTIHYPVPLVTLSVFMVLLANPYLLNYDFVLLLLPFFVLINQNRTRSELWMLVFAYLLPYISLAIFGRQGNNAFLVSTLILLFVFYRDTRRLDVNLSPAYNRLTNE